MRSRWAHLNHTPSHAIYPNLKNKDDGDAYGLALFAFRNNCELEIFTKAKPLTEENTFMDKVREKMKGKKCEEEVLNSSESSDESVKGIHFDDGEEERMDVFDVGMDEGQPRATHVVNQVC
ncbi:unnamed protein product [Vicia faba]|uniref:Uncharacterized protein n=1 Tax=Vicia faba TaxID=3906 RepID=A0AAV0ZW79_VICFA|nr:unnamed protein product [Vicia faba]